MLKLEIELFDTKIMIVWNFFWILMFVLFLETEDFLFFEKEIFLIMILENVYYTQLKILSSKIWNWRENK